MARLVMKFGGTSVADVERIRNVAQHVKREVDAGHEVAVVVSAMSGTTNQLVAWAREQAPLHDAREYDTIVATGEQVTVGLLAIELQRIGIPARSWLGWQIPIRTDNAHGAARIQEIDGSELIRRFGEGQVAVIAGFQGLAPDNRITTLGRGGSDTSAVAIAAAIKADRCDIYTDVDGVYTTDPRVVAKARKLDKISYEEMLEMASLGAKVLQTRSVELAMVYRVRLQVRSSFDAPDAPQGNGPEATGPGTLVCDEEEIVEQQVVSGIAYSKDEAKVTLVKVEDKPGVAARVFGPLADNSINVDMIIQNVSDDGKKHRHHVHRTAGGTRPRRGRDPQGPGRDRMPGSQNRHECRQGFDYWHRHAQPYGRREDDVQDAGRQGDQHPRDHDFRDQGERADRIGVY